jgi:hypothetical protein
MDCREIEFSPKKSNDRINKATHIFDPNVLFRILAFALHMFGAKRKIIAELVNMPEESVKTTNRVVVRDGFEAFLDRRKTELPTIAKAQLTSKKITIRLEGDMIVVDLNSNIGSLRIPVAHKIQVRTILLSLMNSGLLLTHETASIIGISDAHCRQLANKLACNDVEDSLIDKRIGQSQDFRAGPTHKAEIIRQFAARAVTGHSIASDVLTEMVNNQTQTALSSRTVRWHINKLGLKSIKNTLPELVEELKKTPGAAC